MKSNNKIRVNHKNFNTLDNRKGNLEVITCAENVQKRSVANCNNKSTGVRNVNLIGNEYKIQIMKDGIPYRWSFPLDQFEAACEFAKQKRIELFGQE